MSDADCKGKQGDLVWFWSDGRREKWEVIGVNGVNPTWMGSTVNLRRGATTIYGVSTLLIEACNE